MAKISIEQLERIAEIIRKNKNLLRPTRPIVIEVCGTPKSGKSTWINSLNIFLKRNGFNTKVLTERASVCPISDKFNPNFNLWNFFSSASELLEYYTEFYGRVDVIILDRGVFDCLCWFYWFHEYGHISTREFALIKDFLTSERIASIIDIVYIFKAEEKTAIDREFSNLLTKKRGSIMNEQTLAEYNLCVDRCFSEQKNSFRNVEVVENSGTDLGEINFALTAKVLLALNDYIAENIGFFSRDLVTSKDRTWPFDESFSNTVVNFDSRPTVEEDNASIQPVPIIVITNSSRSKVLVVKKSNQSTERSSPERDKDLLYFGGHIRYEDSLNSRAGNFYDLSRVALMREIKEELSIELHIEEYTPFFIYTPDSEKSKKHLAICYVYELDLDHLKFKLDQYEFRQAKGKTSSGKFHEIDKVRLMNLEPWSEIILKTVFGTDPLRQAELKF